jgi:hypothetical protein
MLQTRKEWDNVYKVLKNKKEKKKRNLTTKNIIPRKLSCTVEERDFP